MSGTRPTASTSAASSVARRRSDAQLNLFRDAQPTVEITAPAAGADLEDGEPLAITATAGDDIGVYSVKFYRGDTVLAVDKVAPYTASWTPRATTPGRRQSITAIATDSARSDRRRRRGRRR